MLMLGKEGQMPLLQTEETKECYWNEAILSVSDLGGRDEVLVGMAA